MARRRENTHTFDASRIKQLSERVLFDRPAAQMSPLVREPGRLVVTTGMALTYSLVPF
jgi:factor associated with neutral sphingomyelinase activation